MRILIIRNIPSRIEIRQNTYNIQEIGLAKALTRYGAKCDVLFWTDGEEETRILPAGEGCADGEVHVFYRHGLSVLKNAVFTGCNDLFDLYDILQPCEYNQIQSWLLAKRYPKKTIIYHGPYYNAFNKRYNLMCRICDILLLPRYIRLGTGFIAKSDLARNFLVGKGISEEHVHTVGVGTDLQLLTGAEIESGTEEEPLLVRLIREDRSELKLLYIGRFEKRRNLLFLIDVFQEVVERRPSSRLYMIGTGEETYVKLVQKRIEKAGISDHVIWHERLEQKHLASIYREGDIFLLPTKYEIFGMVLLEAMYFGKVVLTTNNGGSSMLICDGENGFILSEADKKAWTNLILLLAGRPDERRRIGENAHRTIDENYVWDNLVGSFMKQYERLIS